VNTPYQRPKLEVADIFRKFGHLLPKMPLSNYKAINAITNCRTGALGGHQLKCDSCDYDRQAYNSCRNRHCPKCQFTARQRWIEARTEDLLPCQYFHVVFTVPSELRPLMLRNKEVTYDILFRASSDTLKEVARTHFEAEVGFFGVLHTWSQTLIDHPHVHFVVPGGGLSKDKRTWIPCHQDYLLPVKILSQVFRAKFLEKLERAYDANELKLVGAIEPLSNPAIFRDLIVDCAGKSFNVNTRKPFSGPKAVIRYLGGYTHRIAISNHRLVKLEGDQIYFKHRDPDDPSKQKVMSLHVTEFMRRFLLHVLPLGFVRIRHYGILAARIKKSNAATIRELCNLKQDFSEKLQKTWKDILGHLGVDPDRCPSCGCGKLAVKFNFTPVFNTT
jgi:hypothetical protein